MREFYMRDIFFLELRECNRKIREIKDDAERKQAHVLLRETVEKVCELSSLARHEGLLALEEAAYELEESDNRDFLKSIIMLIVDGTAPELVEELCTAKYFSKGVEGVDALQYLIMMHGSLAIQEGERTRVIEDKLLSLVPYEVVKEYNKRG